MNAITHKAAAKKRKKRTFKLVGAWILNETGAIVDVQWLTVGPDVDLVSFKFRTDPQSSPCLKSPVRKFLTSFSRIPDGNGKVTAVKNIMTDARDRVSRGTASWLRSTPS